MRSVGIVEFVLANPALFAKRSVEKLSNFFAPNSFLIRHLYSGYYGPAKELSQPVRLAVVFGTMIWIMAISVSTLCGLFTASNRYFLGGVLIYSACTVGMVLLAVSLSRYRLPLMIFGLLYASRFLNEVTTRSSPVEFDWAKIRIGRDWGRFGCFVGDPRSGNSCGSLVSTFHGMFPTNGTIH